METVLRFVKDLVRVLLEQGGGDLLAPVGGQTVQHQRVGLCVFQQTAGELEAHKIPQTLLALGSAGGGGVPCGGSYDVRIPQALGGVGGQVDFLTACDARAVGDGACDFHRSVRGREVGHTKLV